MERNLRKERIGVVVSNKMDKTTQASGISNSHGVTGGVYKARERIHRGMLIHDY